MGKEYIDYDVLVNWALLPQQQVHRFHLNDTTYVWLDGIVAALFAAEKLDAENYPYLLSYLDNARAAHGLGKSFEFLPPVVPFDKRGKYYTVVDIPKADAIHAAVKKASSHMNVNKRSDKAEAYIYHNVAYSGAFKELYPDTAIRNVDEAILSYIHDQIVPAMLALGWTYNSDRAIFEKPLEIIRDWYVQMDNFLRQGERMTVKSFFHYVALDAYATDYYMPEQYYTDEFRAYVEEMAEKYGYIRTGNMYKPMPVELPDDIESFGQDVLSSDGLLKTSRIGEQVLPLATIQAALANAGINLSDDQITDQLLGNQGAWRRPLIMNGFDVITISKSNSDFPGVNTDGYSFRALVKRRRTDIDHGNRKMDFASGFPIFVSQIAIDDVDATLVYLNMVGSKNSIKANWAAMMQKRYFTYYGMRFKVATAENHVIWQQPLPSGLYQMIMVQKEALPKYIDPTVPACYVITQETGDRMPEHFLATLDKMLEIPVLPAWAEDLWVIGRATGLINYVGNPNKQIGLTAWRIRNNDNWKELISTAIKAKSISI